jgi:hypothetical protein
MSEKQGYVENCMVFLAKRSSNIILKTACNCYSKPIEYFEENSSRIYTVGFSFLNGCPGMIRAEDPPNEGFFVKRHFKFFGNFTKEGFRIFEEIKTP